MTDITKCVACGQKIERVLGDYTLPSGRVVKSWFDNHHCPESFENMRQGIDRREQEFHERPRNEAQRLVAGFNMLALSGDS